jgi:hypothetical protein
MRRGTSEAYPIFLLHGEAATMNGVSRASFVVCLGVFLCATLLAAYELNGLTLTLALVCAVVSFLHFRYEGR